MHKMETFLTDGHENINGINIYTLSKIESVSKYVKEKYGLPIDDHKVGFFIYQKLTLKAYNFS